MRNIKLTIEYDGTDYAGWQRQTSRRHPASRQTQKTIQEQIEIALKKLFKEDIKLIGLYF